jgi:cysteine synthase
LARLAIAVTLNGDIDYMFCATSACGAIRGCSKYVRERNLKTKIFTVDAVGGIIFGGHYPRTRRGWVSRAQTSVHLAEQLTATADSFDARLQIF